MARLSADVLIQAGHEGRTTGATGSTGRLGREIDWTPIVANEAARLLAEAGYSVLRVKADDRDDVLGADVKLAFAIHFDGSTTKCASGASIGYPSGSPAGSNKPSADRWKAIYKTVWPHKWMPDNFTAALRGYGDYKDWSTDIAELVIELGEISCDVQATWLKPRLTMIGRLLAHWASVELGGAVVPRTVEIDDTASAVAILAAKLDATIKLANSLNGEVNGLQARLAAYEKATIAAVKGLTP